MASRFAFRLGAETRQACTTLRTYSAWLRSLSIANPTANPLALSITRHAGLIGGQAACRRDGGSGGAMDASEPRGRANYPMGHACILVDVLCLPLARPEDQRVRCC